MKSVNAKLMNFIERFSSDERGISALEYGLLAAGIAVVVYAAAGEVGTGLLGLLEGIGGELTAATPA